MSTLKERDYTEDPGYTESASGSAIATKISGGYNAYDNILKLIDIVDFTFDIPALSFIEGSAFYSSGDRIVHGLQYTPFIEVEWRDPSFVGSGALARYFVDATMNDSDIIINFGVIAQYFGFEEDPPQLEGLSFLIRIYIYDLNTKKRLDTFTK